MNEVRKVIIIGSGPAGYAEALYNARAALVPLVLAGGKWGGQLMLTTKVENWPGSNEGIMGPDLMEKMRQQAKKFGAEIVDKNVTAVDFSKRPFEIHLGGVPPAGGPPSEVYLAEAVIVATGAEAKMLEVGEEKFLGRGVSTCAVCDAPFYKDKITFVVGGGDAAMEEALALVKHAREVIIVHRRDQFRASQIMQDRVLKDHADKIKVIWDSQVAGVAGEENLTKIVVENVKTQAKQELAVDGLFIAIGHKPNTQIFKGQLELDKKGYLVTRWGDLGNFPTQTSVTGVFGAGDVVDFRYRQAVTAAGFGVMAALDAERWLEQQG
ncbi:thioredoxin-disulfide reductase [Candidatus Beckwithbacteria bacterium RIFCSPHIGHO2_12_FULL_49_13]|nr:MAG: thioredoxin-disulfide reductase [Candidatus Beckwithbacteria bacterium RIFCSPHIGHO2_12_FULL_49_13]